MVVAPFVHMVLPANPEEGLYTLMPLSGSGVPNVLGAATGDCLVPTIIFRSRPLWAGDLLHGALLVSVVIQRAGGDIHLSVPWSGMVPLVQCF
jgi:hypothetical protein